MHPLALTMTAVLRLLAQWLARPRHGTALRLWCRMRTVAEPFGLLLGMILAWSGSSALAQVQAEVQPQAQAQAQAIWVSSHQPEMLLGPSLQLLEDASRQFTPATIPADAAWRPHRPEPSLNFGFSKSAWWARVQLRNADAQPVDRILDMNSSLLDHVEVHILRADGRLTTLMRSGDRQPFATRGEAVRSFATRLHFEPGEQYTLLMRFASHDGLNEIVTPTLYTPHAFTQHVQAETLAYGLYFGVLATVLLYNVFLFITTRQASFGHYVAYLACFLLWGLVFRGYAFQYLWPDSPHFNNQALAVVVSLLYLTLGLFLMSYLDTRHTLPPRLHKLLAISTAANGIGILPAFFNLYLSTFLLNTAIGLCVIFCLITTGAVLLYKGSRPARYFASAFAVLTVAALLYYLRMIDVVPANSFTDNLLQVGSAAECLLLAFGLADQMNTLKTEKLRAERQALAAQSALNTRLEGLVAERTVELEKANERLASLSITDELTGAFNRRQFNKDLAAIVAMHTRHHTPLALCLLDVDHFKAYNDRYGHPAGDEVLHGIAQSMRQQMQRASDHVYRVGGEEFAMLLDTNNETPEKVRAFIEHVHGKVHALAMKHEGSPQGVVTVSMGLVIVKAMSQVRTAAELYSAADALLYEAKRAGRNQVITRILD